jgi:O-antigen ligase
MLNLQAKPVELNIFWTATVLAIVSMFAGFMLDEPLFYLVPAALLFAYQLVLNYKKIFFLLLLVTPGATEFYSSSGFSTTLPTEPIMIVLMLTFLFFVIMKREILDKDFFTHPLAIIIYIHFGWMMFTTIFADEIVISLKYLLAKLWFIVSFFAVGGLVIKEFKDFKIAFWCLFVPTLILTIYTLNNHLHYQFRFSEVNKTMVPFFRNHVNYAVFLALMLPLTINATKWYHKYSWQKMLLKFGVVILLLGIYFSYTRSSWLSVAGALAAYFLIKHNKLMPAVAATIVLVIAFVIYMLHDNKYLDYAPEYTKTIYHSNFSDHMESTISLEDVSSAERIYRWVAAMHMVEDKPGLGFGPGQFYFNYKEYTVNKFETYISRNSEESTVHNYYLQVTVEQGFLGLAIWVTLLVLILYKGQSLYNKFKDPFYKGMTMAVTLSIITIIVNIALSDLIEADKIGTAFVMFMAVLINLELQYRRKLERG